ncbi:hypothetical protein pneo_cds_1026 [Pandoravirus neocaledonia]|uniref:Uncharacterized protein n=1 Tax=Pandoravirus neocaledonia TaxID=2107708 RepID=A0A2U7UDW9_9VIRU|nr:hypothetical protein pneo_cds_1026 [Pandoravirus neocaledonia]AVK76633.1 hypothetical protein pneo_cds_1026 [Pandoravirus neocaledonia]
MPSMRYCPYGFNYTPEFDSPLTCWLPAAALVMALGRRDRSRCLVDMGMWMTMAASFVCSTYGGWIDCCVRCVLAPLRRGLSPHKGQHLHDTKHLKADRFDGTVNDVISRLAPDRLHPLLLTASARTALGIDWSVRDAVIAQVVKYVARAKTLLGAPEPAGAYLVRALAMYSHSLG